IPRGFQKGTVGSGIDYYIRCGEDCPNYNSTEACLGGTTSNTTCIWCERANICITRNNKDVHIFEVNGCQTK
ncbi:unnamed protein product, partial [Schistosoma intercalatum]